MPGGRVAQSRPAGQFAGSAGFEASIGDDAPSYEDLPKTRTERQAASQPVTLGALRKSSCWLWLYCNKCGRGVPAALAPFIIRWGEQASGNRLRASFRCAVCGGKGATTIVASWKSMGEGAWEFPVGGMTVGEMSPFNLNVQTSRVVVRAALLAGVTLLGILGAQAQSRSPTYPRLIEPSCNLLSTIESSCRRS
jgi:hypothetical protein